MKLPEFTLLMCDRLSAHGSRIWNFLSPCFPYFWDVDTLDWQSKNIDSILSIAQKQVHDGSIILMHDGYQTSVDAALKIADLFTEKGYVFVTADQLLLT